MSNERHPDLLPGEQMFRIDRVLRIDTLTVDVREEGQQPIRMRLDIEEINKLFDYNVRSIYVCGKLEEGVMYIRGVLAPSTVPYPNW